MADTPKTEKKEVNGTTVYNNTYTFLRNISESIDESLKANTNPFVHIELKAQKELIKQIINFYLQNKNTIIK